MCEQMYMHAINIIFFYYVFLLGVSARGAEICRSRSCSRDCGSSLRRLLSVRALLRGLRERTVQFFSDL